MKSFSNIKNVLTDFEMTIPKLFLTKILLVHIFMFLSKFVPSFFNGFDTYKFFKDKNLGVLFPYIFLTNAYII